MHYLQALALMQEKRMASVGSRLILIAQSVQPGAKCCGNRLWFPNRSRRRRDLDASFNRALTAKPQSSAASM